MNTANMTCGEYTTALSSNAPVPGGGGASALIGALGIALGNMVGSLTIRKKKYADVENDMLRLNEKASELLALADRDAEVIEPLSRAYSMPKDTPEQAAEKDRVMEGAMKAASEVPLEIMQRVCEALELIEEYALKGSAIAVSDAGVAAAVCKAALEGASLNVFVNTKLMKDREFASNVNGLADAMLGKYTALADRIFVSVGRRLR